MPRYDTDEDALLIGEPNDEIVPVLATGFGTKLRINQTGFVTGDGVAEMIETGVLQRLDGVTAEPDDAEPVVDDEGDDVATADGDSAGDDVPEPEPAADAPEAGDDKIEITWRDDEEHPLEHYNRNQLREICRALGLRVSGKPAELVARIRAHEAEA